jgi:hypothetical protein
MATIHSGTTMVPTKLELLAAWLPGQHWYEGSERPELSKAGGFRLDDPAGEVGIEFAFVSDGTTTYHVPMTYRGAPLRGAEDGLIGTSEHGVLGTRWVYDAAHDPVAVNALLDFVGGGAPAQSQSQSDTLDESVGRRWTGPDRPADMEVVRVLGERTADAGAPGAVDADWLRPAGGTARGPVVLVR